MSVVKFVFNDFMRVSPRLANTIGTSTYGNIIYQRQSLYDHACAVAFKAGIRDFERIRNLNHIEALLAQASSDRSDTIYIILSANKAINNQDGACLLLQKLSLAGVTCGTENVSPSILCCAGPDAFRKYLNILARNETVILDWISDDKNIIKNDNIFTDISNLEEFNRFFSSTFDVRHFNNISSESDSIVKSSQDLKKIKQEHDYYYLLPKEMQHWFVQPFNYKTEKGVASYTMEKLNIADAALQWIHNSFSLPQFKIFIEHSLRFIQDRPRRTCDGKRMEDLTRELFIEKVNSRISDLKAMEEYSHIQELLSAATGYQDIDAIILKYQSIFDAHASKIKNIDYEVIGHGDFCFSNILYDRSSGIFKLIDPRGAENENELWTHPYYDIAKLSHSALGLYDYLNHGLYEIVLDQNNMIELQIISPDINPYRELFKSELAEAGIDIFLCRLFESSLFFSMLPFHIDQPRKVLGFILNGIAILEELENNV